MTANTAPLRVGIDFGRTIATIEDGPAPHSYEMVGHIVSKFGAENTYIVSKAGPNMEMKIRKFLEETMFYELCGFLPHNVIFVREYAEKALIVREHNISVFFDDHVKVVRSLTPLQCVRRIFWMHADPRELQMIEKQQRHKIVITSNWARTMKFFQRFPSKHTPA